MTSRANRRIAVATIAASLRTVGRLLNTSHKIALSARVMVLARVLYLAPWREAGGRYNTCPMATEGCRAACLGHSSGHMVMLTHKLARVRKTHLYYQNRPLFFAALRRDLAALERAAKRLGMKPAARLNGSSDLPWEASGIMAEFPAIQFYDYTKIERCAIAARTDPSWPSNYHLTFSFSGENHDACRRVLAAGGTVAVVFSHVKPLPATWEGFPVVSGDDHDARFLDAPGTVIGLKAKGAAKRDRSGFVIW